ncbi:surface carbohydrate biosynthesis protein [Alkalibacillus almallahensis]|uniref:surface carbohydrate biosynthesis protein n=1 Tax=Alkalibacillus almallahensis TaxID=1379154 RepID=UPI001422D655|nr:surface carbohydrate biosynthesis protein [Alkalibacillus almallahensis]NIK12263.1 surface carbohydrate biosynthesis protein [Alkalibacillus almallahensis]
MVKIKNWLYLPIEIKVRESDAKLLLAYYAAKKGYEVVIGDHYMVQKASHQLPQGIFFSKGYSRGVRKRVITDATSHGHKVVELDEEGLIFDDHKYLQDRMKKEMLALVTQEYCWGQSQMDVMTSAYPDLKNRCHVTGNPRFDLLKPKFSTIYQEEAKQIKRQFGEFVLINTRFARYNTAKGKKDDPHFKDITLLYYRFIDLVKQSCERFPDINFVIRPHPGENVRSYLQEFSRYRNVHVIHEGNITKWLLAAKAIIHNGCTSGLEAYLLGRPVISYVPPISSKKDQSLPDQVGIKASQVDEVLEIINNVVNLNHKKYVPFKSELNSDLMLYHCEWSNNQHAYESILKLMDAFPEIYANQSQQQHSLDQHLLLKKSKKEKKRRFSLTKSEIKAFFSKLDKIEGDSKPVNIVPIANNLFRLNGTGV